MISPILKIFARILIPIILFISFWLMLRGHQNPGGGFIGGLVYAVAYTLLLFGLGHKEVHHTLPFDPRTLIGVGLGVALFSSILPVIMGLPFFKAVWKHFTVPILGEMVFSSPQTFDFGVYLVVSGSLMIILNAFEEE